MRKQRKIHRAKPKKRRLASRHPTVASFGLLPVVSCVAGNNIFNNGMGHAIISRTAPDGSIVAGMFLIDAYCLGVKNAALLKMSPAEHQTFQEKAASTDILEEIKPCCLKKMVLQSVDYAASFGIPPHRDHKKAALLLAGIDCSECETEYQFGHLGKPFYVTGPNDTPARIRQILEKLSQHRGEGGFDYLALAGGMDEDGDDEFFELDPVDDPDEVDDLLTDMDEALPFRARFLPDAFSRLREKFEWLQDKSPDVHVMDIIYEEDTGGIMCELKIDGNQSGRPVTVSLTHLLPDESLPFSEAIRSYQKRRVENLQKQGRRDDVIWEA